MPQYLMLIYNPSEGADLSPEEMGQMHSHWNDYTQGLRDAGLFVAGDALQGIDVATTVRIRDGETQITDGPFAETREYLAGYYLLEAADLDTVLSWAERAPNVRFGSTEVRPIWDTSQAQAGAGQAAAQA
jgi:hypothetical protein